MKAYARMGLALHWYLTSSVDGGAYQLHAPVALLPGREVEILGWASEALWTFWRKKIFSPLRVIEPRFVGSAARSP